MLIRSGRLLVVGGVVFVAALASVQCSKPAAPPPSPAAKSTAPPLLGDMTPTVSVKELMQYMIDPVSDNVFDAISSTVTPKGIVDVRPTTDADWEKVQVGAVSLAEGIYLLKVPRPFTPPGDVNNSTGPNPPELSPTQIKEKLDKDPVVWDAKIQQLRNAALAVSEVVKNRSKDPEKNAQALFEASGTLDEACEACHLEYWYPGDKKAVDEYKNAKVTYTKPQKPGADGKTTPPKN